MQTPIGKAILSEITRWVNDVKNQDEAERLDGALQALRYLSDKLVAMGELPDADRQELWRETLSGHMGSRPQKEG